MYKLRVLIVSEGQVIDVQDFDDPRAAFVSDFNRLNRTTPYRAVLDGDVTIFELPEARPLRMQVGCRPGTRRCASR